MKTKLELTTLVILTSVLVVFLFPLILNNNQILANETEFPSELQIPGRIQGTGTYFEIKDSEYLNITLKSSEEIKLILESIPRMISLDISSSTNATSTNLTISGLEPNTTYYKYEDSYKNEIEIRTDKNGTFSWQQDLTKSHHIWIQETKGTVFLPDDCSKYGIWDEINRVCTLTQNVTSSIEIATNSIILDCNSHSLTGLGWGYGIYLSRKEDVVIKNCTITHFSYGIYSYYSPNNNFNYNNINSNGVWGVTLYYSSSNTISNNNMNLNGSYGLVVYASSNNTVTKNIIKDSANAGGIALAYSSNSNSITKNEISGCYGCGIGLYLYPNENTIISNTISNNNSLGICLVSSSNNLINNNEISFNRQQSFYFYDSSNNNLTYHNNLIKNFPPLVRDSTGNLFDNGYPEGGNYWSDYTGIDEKSGPNQDQPGSDGIGDTPYTFTGSQDKYPFIKESGWEAPVNQAPAISNLGQFKSDAITSISEGEITTESVVVFRATLDDPDNDQVKLQIELKEFSQPFNEQDLLESEFVSSGNIVAITKSDLTDGDYRWRARAIDSRGGTSEWVEFGISGNIDFIVSLPLSTKAAKLAKELINYPYLWGGKGWDYNLSEFVALSAIKTGYNFWNRELNQGLGGIDFGTGVDCSGLIMWVYDRSFDPLKPRFNNFVKAEGADEQYRYNTATTTESELQPGDVMFFDNVPKDGFIDHVAMYVGESGSFDVVSAVDRTQGILGVFKDILKQLPKFVAFKQVIQAPQPAVLASAYSPIDLVLTDPDGFTITPTITISSDLEYLRQIPGVLYYSEMEKGADGNPIDQVYSYTLKAGDYTLRVLPASGASPAETYSLDFKTGEQVTILAQNVSLSQAPSQGYGITTSATGTISTFIPVSIDIKPGSYPNSINFGSNGTVPFAIFGSPTFDVRQINPTTIQLANAPVKLKNNGQPIASFEDINGDGFTDIIAHVITKSLQLTVSDIKANLEGKLFDGTIIKGFDSVRIVY